jgi:hypothetical protein
VRGCEYSFWAATPRKVPRKHTPDTLFHFPKSSFGEHKMMIKFTPPKRRFWKDGQKMKCGFSIEFSTIRIPRP